MRSEWVMKNDVSVQNTALCKPNTKSGGKPTGQKFTLNLYTAAIRSVGLLLARAMPLNQVAPFGAAYLSMERRFSADALVAAAMTAVGYLTLFDMTVAAKYLIAAAMYLIFLFAAGRDGEDITTTAAVSAAGSSVALANLIHMVWHGFSAGGVLILFCDVGLCILSGLIFEKNKGILRGKKNALFTMNNEEKLSLAILASIMLVGFSDIRIDGYFSASGIIGLWATAVFALCGGGGCGAVCGAICGLLSGTDGMFICSAIFAICGIAGGIAAKLGKTSVGVVMSVTAAALLLVCGADGIGLVGYIDIPLFLIATILTPDYFIRSIKRMSGVGKPYTDEQRCTEYVKSRLSSAADSFRNLSDTFLDLSDKHNTVDMEDVSALFDGVADRVCRECSRMSDCWVTGFNSTYKSMFRLLEIAERKGEVAEGDADDYFSKKCLRLRAVVREMNRLFEIYKINCIWKSKLCENRELAGQQLWGISEILDGICCEICEEKPDISAEEEIRARLFSGGIETGILDVTLSPKGRYSARIELINCKNPEECRRKTESALRSVLGVKLEAVGATETKNGLIIRYAEPEGFKIDAASSGRGRSEECGDSSVMRYLSGGKYAAALSDGMGTGHRASRDSGATVRLLGDFLEAGFNREVAVRLVNSIMVMKSANEAFATVDMCIIDLFGGEAEFIKNGAEPSYIKRADSVETVRSASLPVGVVQSVEIESFAHKLDAGDIIVMLSDGLQIKEYSEEWIKTIIKESDSNMPPAELADRIIDMAVTLRGGEIEDDMTVMVMKLIER